MNFASKKLDVFKGNTTVPSRREKALLAENRKLKRKNKRLSTAMLYLVDQIEIRLPLWSPKKPSDTNDKVTKLSPTEETREQKKPKRKIIGKTWKPEKLDSRPQRRKTDKIRPTPAPAKTRHVDSVEPISATTPIEANLEKPQKTEAPEINMQATEEQLPNEAELSPKLEEEEVNLLAAPIKDKARELPNLTQADVFVKPEAKKTTAQEASLTYLAVSIASSPVPKTQDDDEGLIEHHIAQQSDVMREAMLRRANRLRW